MKKIVFMGGVGKPGEFGGELTKNKMIIQKLRKYDPNLRVIDTYGSRRSFRRLPCVIGRFIAYLMQRNVIFVFSSSLINVYPFLKLSYFFPIRHRMILWGIGGIFAKKTAEGSFDKKYFGQLETIIVEGEKMKREFEACGIHTAIVTQNFKQLQALPVPDKVKDGKIHFLFISRIMPEKGVSYIFDCIERLNGNGLEGKFEVDFYGPVDDAYAETFGMRLKANSNARYLHSLDLFDWNNYERLARYHFMLFPTYWASEGCPGAVIDAFIAGVPLIASDWSLNREYIEDGRTGIIIPVHDSDRLCQAMSDVISGKYDIDRMAQACQQEAMRFDTDRVLTEEYFSKVLHL